ncbi:MAG TPA: glycosyltransferase [Cyanobacteria bacterium UBA11149]|nr:glycosyltransferase [Cyanobacteria bacterium UBA11367]HBE60162.1 glycosyltransferase [Cyanobacteria bacterium UBA11366]HBK64872.1 glycosyltransferase [Cyanobacteria bacterium UBA11166]HBR75481.1 glycosyltransferase [Cyanobacteria bacterium UBA11159]HBS70579.1 glycosyltransferase [Cyanobacteria bacterium UBA11153]HBW88771.1 glycosyltransferase [Cyanobacteria bacterium UBA11149]HCA98219.1 glycosyltransferase [Cyanobacteria bacterium UBA9226]
MKILWITPYLGSSYGGTTQVVLELAKTLGGNIHLDLITTDANGSDKLAYPLELWIDRENYRIQYFPSWHRNDLIFSPSLINWLFNHVSSYDIVHTHTIFAPLISISHRICKAKNIPYIMTPHGMLEPWALAYKAWKKRIYYTLWEKFFLQQASAIQVLAQSEANSIKSLGLNQPVVVIPNGIHPDEFQSLPNPEIFYQNFPNTRNKTIILFLGRIDPKKGLDLLAPAFAKVHNHFPQTHLIVAGPDNIGFLSTARSYFAKAGCIDEVTFTGMLTDSLKYSALAAASLYVAPSYSEGFSMSVLEGMASGLPSIITTGCNFPEAAHAKAAYVVSLDSDAIANALLESLKNPQQAKEMGNRAINFICQNYTWEQAAKRLIEVYTAIAESKPLPDYLNYTGLT